MPKRGRSLRSFVAVALGSLVLVQLMLSNGSTGLGAPSRRVMLGVAHLPDASLASVDAFSHSIGQPPALWTIWRHWKGPGSGFPRFKFLNGLADRGIAPLIMWQPDDSQHPHDRAVTFADIASGDYDAYITNWASTAAGVGQAGDRAVRARDGRHLVLVEHRAAGQRHRGLRCRVAAHRQDLQQRRGEQRPIPVEPLPPARVAFRTCIRATPTSTTWGSRT